MSLRFSISTLKYAHFWTLVVNTILILIKFPIQRYLSCRHLKFDPTYEIGHHGGFSPFWKLGILVLVDDSVLCIKTFLEVMGPYKNVKQKLSLDSKVFMGPYYMAWTKLSIYYLRILEKTQIWAQTQPSGQFPFHKLNFDNSNQNEYKSSYQSFVVLSNFTGLLYFIHNILFGIAKTNNPVATGRKLNVLCS